MPERVSPRPLGRPLRLVETPWPAIEPRRTLPAQPRAIVGRQHELALARRRLLRAEVRLLTLTGPPGVGKTRLALALAGAVAAEFDVGVAFVDLAPITDPDLVIDAIARGLRLRDVDRRVALEVVEEFVRDKSLLLILDNFEQVIEAAEVVSELLSASSELKILATSRAPLHLAWERELPIPPLKLPAWEADLAADAVATSAAGQLFIERAQAVAPDFVLGDADAAAVAEICARLDGLPLAIELAAARIKLFPPRALLRRLVRAEPDTGIQSSPLRLLVDQARDLPPRQQTLLRAITWSYDLLAADEQAVFRRLSVFVGGCDLEAAEAVGAAGTPTGLDIIASLIDKSLLGREEQADGEPRLRMLQTLRDYAAEQLEASGEAETVRARHASYFVEMVERAGGQLVGPRQQSWFARFERERDNLVAAELWTRQYDVPLTVRLVAALWPFWLAREDASHARDRIEAILPLFAEVSPSPTLGRAVHGAALIAEKLGDYATCRSLLQRGVLLARQFDDRRALALVLDSLGRQEFIEGRYAEARVMLEESHAILREMDDPVGLARLLSHLGFLEHLEGRRDAARAIFEQGLAVARAAEDQHRVAEFMDNLGNVADADEDFEGAARMYQEAIELWRQLGTGHWLAMSLNNLGLVEVRRGDLAGARGHLLEALSLAHRIGNRRRMAYTISAAAALARSEGHTERAAGLDAIATATIAEIGAARQGRAAAAVAASTSAPPMSLEQAVEDTLSWLENTPEPAESPVAAAPAATGLTRRERQVVALLARGLTNRQIAEALVLTEGTAENYVQRILGKLGFNNRAQIAVWAVEHGLDRDPRA